MKTKRSHDPIAVPPTVELTPPVPSVAVFVSLRRRACPEDACGCGGYAEMIYLDAAEQVVATCALDKDAARWLSEHLALYAGKPKGAPLQ